MLHKTTFVSTMSSKRKAAIVIISLIYNVTGITTDISALLGGPDN